jgi:transcriptional regulator with XRE-family HTH domain
VPLARVIVNTGKFRLVEAAELLQKLLSSLGLSQTELADLIGVERSFLSRCLRGERMPGRMSCLLLAGIAESAEERTFWLKHSGIENRQVGLIRRALAMAEPEAKNKTEQALLAWWRQPASSVEESVKSVVEKLLESEERR